MYSNRRTLRVYFIYAYFLGAATLSAFDKMLSNPSNFQQNPLESQVNKEDTLYFRQNACVNEIGHLNFKQIPSTQVSYQVTKLNSFEFCMIFKVLTKCLHF